MKLKLFHHTSSILVLLMIICFEISSLSSEFLGDYTLIANVKKAILYSLPLLMIFMIIAAVSAKKLALLYTNNPYAQIKVKRMKLMGMNGLVFLMPLAILLNYFAQNSIIDTTFYLLQCLEIICGLFNILFFVKIFIDEKK